MANPQLENGYTRIANELLEALARKELSGRGFRCLVAIIRETFGWNRKEAIISGYRLSEMTGIAAPHVHKVLKELEAIGIIEKESHPKGSTIRLKKDYEKWVSSTRKSNTLEGNTLESITTEGITLEGNGSITLEGNTSNTLEGNTDYPTGLVAERIPGGAKERKEKKEIYIEKEKKSQKKNTLTDKEFIDSLKSNRAYRTINIDDQLARMDAWLLTKPNRKKTRVFILNWLNRIEVPVDAPVKVTAEELAELKRKDEELMEKLRQEQYAKNPPPIADTFKECWARVMRAKPKGAEKYGKDGDTEY